MVELVLGQVPGRSITMKSLNREPIDDKDLRIIHNILLEVVFGFDASEYSNYFLENRHVCLGIFKKLKSKIESTCDMFHEDIDCEEWIAIVESFRAVMMDFFEYNEFHTRLGYTFEDCIDLFSRIVKMAICREVDKG
jgi:hypothetical protein